MDLTAVQRWLWERDMFYRLLAIPFFARFKYVLVYINQSILFAGLRHIIYQQFACERIDPLVILVLALPLDSRFLNSEKVARKS